MTVKEILGALKGPSDVFSVHVCYDSDEYDITNPSPVQEAFSDYIVSEVWSPDPHKFNIMLKEVYVKREGT